MRTIVHISDLHFGRTDPKILPVLTKTIVDAAPHVVVVSGDLTQRAKDSQFAAARAFMDTLPKPQIIVPGNHDIPFYNVIRRWLYPLSAYRRAFGSDLEPHYSDSEISVVGLNSARSLTFKNGRLNVGQLERSCARFTDTTPDALRIVATHHPFALEDAGTSDVIGRAEMAIAAFAKCRVDVILSGHLHTSHTLIGTEQYDDGQHAALLIQAGTATSNRVRDGEANAFNILHADGNRLAVHRLTWNGTAFETALMENFERGATGWKKL
jgi:3',5'-cyclic AMP phosphodiesterase CpdA